MVDPILFLLPTSVFIISPNRGLLSAARFLAFATRDGARCVAVFRQRPENRENSESSLPGRFTGLHERKS